MQRGSCDGVGQVPAAICASSQTSTQPPWPLHTRLGVAKLVGQVLVAKLVSALSAPAFLSATATAMVAVCARQPSGRLSSILHQ